MPPIQRVDICGRIPTYRAIRSIDHQDPKSPPRRSLVWANLDQDVPTNYVQVPISGGRSIRILVGSPCGTIEPITANMDAHNRVRMAPKSIEMLDEAGSDDAEHIVGMPHHRWSVRTPHTDQAASSPEGRQLICQRQGPMPAMITKDDEDAEFIEHTHGYLPANWPCALGHDADAGVLIKPRATSILIRLTAKCPRHVYAAVVDARKTVLHQPPVRRVSAQCYHHASLDILARCRRRMHRPAGNSG